MPDSTYHAPSTLADAVSLMLRHENCKILAGGTDLLVQARSDNTSLGTVIDIKSIPGMTAVDLNKEGLFIGAAAPAQSITEREDIKRLFPGLVESIDLIGSTQIQGRCSVGGNLCNASPAADSVPALIASSAVCEIHGPDGSRRVKAEDFNTGPGQNSLGEAELLTGLFIPRPVTQSATAYLRFIPRSEMDIAVAGVAASLTIDDSGFCSEARIAIGAVGPTAELIASANQAVTGTQLEESAIEAAANAASSAARPISDKRGSAEFRRKIVTVLTRRALLIAKDRAMQAVQMEKQV